jgi:hypoxanthine phosphoribosyltransferase
VPGGPGGAVLAEQAWKILKEAELVCDADTVRAAVERLGRGITQRLSGENPLVLVVMRGGVFFAGQLLPHLRFPLELDYVHATRYGAHLSGRQLEWKSFSPETVRGRCVLVLDDILDAGDTLAGIHKQVLESGASACHIAVLTEKDTGARKPIRPDFVGITLPNRYVFGCGLDVSGAWRNLPEIYALKEED